VHREVLRAAVPAAGTGPSLQKSRPKIAFNRRTLYRTLQKMPIFSPITLGLAPILSPEQHHEEMHQPVLLAGVDPLQLVSGA
jgi:hypothetical protein